jgi:hypothetical protein
MAGNFNRPNHRVPEPFTPFKVQQVPYHEVSFVGGYSVPVNVELLLSGNSLQAAVIFFTQNLWFSS